MFRVTWQSKVVFAMRPLDFHGPGDLQAKSHSRPPRKVRVRLAKPSSASTGENADSSQKYLGVDTSTDQSAVDPSTRKLKIAEHVGDAEVEDERKMLSFSLLA